MSPHEILTKLRITSAQECGDFATKWRPANEPDSTIGLLPSDDQLIAWAKEVLKLSA